MPTRAQLLWSRTAGARFVGRIFELNLFILWCRFLGRRHGRVVLGDSVNDETGEHH